MHIWLITVGEPLPTDGANDRLHRTGTLAKLLVEKGHSILWWSSTLDHVRKKQRFDTDTSIAINDHLQIKLLHSLTYKKNVSIQRIINHYGVARKFKRQAESEPQPDIILCSLPTLELSLAATEYGKKRGIPVILDVRDLWPDVFLDQVPMWGQCPIRLLLHPMFKTVRSACKNATAIIGITPNFVDWGVNYANRTRSTLDQVFPMGYSESSPSNEEIGEAKKRWDKYKLTKNEFIICFFGTIGRYFKAETIIDATRKLNKQSRAFRFILCGRGDSLAQCREKAKDCENIIFPGWVGKADIWTLMSMSSVGLVNYLNIKNYTMNLPNKPIEYLSSGLPIVSNLDGLLKKLLSTYNCGVTYKRDDPDDLASILMDLYDHPQRLKEMSQNAYALYREKFVAEKVYTDLNDYLESVCKSYRK